MTDGNILSVTWATKIAIKATEFSDADYYHYDVTEGTFVAQGSYNVGENGDIPAGRYEIYAATEATVSVGYYVNKADFEARNNYRYDYIKAGERVDFRLEEGYIFLVEGADCIMKKAGKLVFD